MPLAPLERPAGAHWKLTAIDSYAGPSRPLAWVDHAHDQRCHEWARARRAPTLLVGTDPRIGIGDEHVATLRRWAGSLSAA